MKLENEQDLIIAIKTTANHFGSVKVWVKKEWTSAVFGQLRRADLYLAQPEAEEVMDRSIAILIRNVQDDKFDRNNSLQAYFLGICERQGKVLIREKIRNRKYENHVEHAYRLEQDDMDTPERWVIRQDETQLVRNLLHAFEQPCQDILRGLFLEGKTLREIAHDLDIPLSTIKKKSPECQKTFKKLLEKWI